MKTTIKSVLAAIAATFAASVFAAVPSSITKFVPEMMNYQGYLANPSTGAAYTDGIYDIECRLYRQASGGTAIWGAKYSVYVKDGYFNIMLGDGTAADVKSTVGGSSSPTYAKDALWKALWYDSSVSEKNNLWLGVTPLQSSTHATIASPVEISPRQQLLAAPYAFRAQSAKYADAAQGDFTVSGALTVNGSISLPSTYQIKHLKATSNSLILGYQSGYAQSSGPAITNAASYYGVLSYYDQKYTSGNGNIIFGLSSSKSFQFNTGAFAVTNSQSISLHNNNSDLTMRANDTKLAGSYTTVSSINTTTITGRYAKVASQYSVTLAPATNDYVYGQGKVAWKLLGSTASNRQPMILESYQVPITAGNNYAKMDLTGYPTAQWSAMVVGFETDKATCPAPNAVRIDKGGAINGIRVYFSSSVSVAQSIVVHVLFIQKAFCEDRR